jgi:hypothetical protein
MCGRFVLDRIDKLMILAKKKFGNDGKEISVCFVEPVGGHWVAKADIWDGRPGGDIQRKESVHGTVNEAIEALHDLAEEYPNSQDITIIVNDIPS